MATMTVSELGDAHQLVLAAPPHPASPHMERSGTCVFWMAMPSPKSEAMNVTGPILKGFIDGGSWFVHMSWCEGFGILGFGVGEGQTEPIKRASRTFV